MKVMLGLEFRVYSEGLPAPFDNSYAFWIMVLPTSGSGQGL